MLPDFPSAEIQLWQAVITCGIRESTRKGEIGMKARRWIKSGDFATVCGYVGADATVIREELKHHHARRQVGAVMEGLSAASRQASAVIGKTRRRVNVDVA